MKNDNVHIGFKYTSCNKMCNIKQFDGMLYQWDPVTSFQELSARSLKILDNSVHRLLYDDDKLKESIFYHDEIYFEEYDEYV